MERAARSLLKMKLSSAVSADDLACAGWRAAVGARIAARTQAIALVRGKLVVEVEDAVWQKQLFGLRGQILHRIHSVLGDASVTEVEFRIRKERRPVQSAISHAISQGSDALRRDEADGIADPALRIVYKQARKKAIG